MKKIVKVEKLTNQKYLNLYKITYDIDGKLYEYIVSSRRNKENLEIKKHKTDAVRAVPYIKKDDKIFVVLIKEFRYAIGRYIYGTPAGLVDNNESTKTAIIRELKEEIGAKVLKLEKVQQTAYSSAGLTDETLECFYAQVELLYSQSLDENECIKYELVELNNIPNFLKTHKFGLQSALMLKAFYFETKYKMLEKEL